jgi:hypothetical protein
LPVLDFASTQLAKAAPTRTSLFKENIDQRVSGGVKVPRRVVVCESFAKAFRPTWNPDSRVDGFIYWTRWAFLGLVHIAKKYLQQYFL